MSTDNGEDGFTLIEVLVAFAITALGLTTLYSTLGSSWRNAADARFAEETLSHARSHMALISGGATPANAPPTGQYDNGAPWRVAIRPLAIKDAPVGMPSRPILITLEAFDPSGRKIVALKTIELVKIAP